MLELMAYALNFYPTKVSITQLSFVLSSPKQALNYLFGLCSILAKFYICFNLVLISLIINFYINFN
jgi:hypothetical protein